MVESILSIRSIRAASTAAVSSILVMVVCFNGATLDFPILKKYECDSVNLLFAGMGHSHRHFDTHH